MPADQSNSDKAGSDLRGANMNRRRARILEVARAIIASEGFEALRLRDLAKRADITVPTIYNLIGSKEDILAALIADMTERLDSPQFSRAGMDPIAAAVAMIDQMVALFGSDETYYRAAFLAWDRRQQFAADGPQGVSRKSYENVSAVGQAAREQGCLEERVDHDVLRRQIWNSYRVARDDWIHGYIDLAGFRIQALQGILLCLMADACPAFRHELHSALLRLDADAPVRSA